MEWKGHDLWDLLFQNALDAIFLIDSKDQKIIDANRTALDLIDYALEEIVGKEFTFFVRNKFEIEDDFEEEDAFIGSSLENQFLVKKNGELVSSESTWKILPTEDGNTQILATFRDITDRKKTQEEVFKQKRFYELILTNLDDYLMVLDDNFRYIYSNKPHFLTPDLQLIGKTDRELCIELGQSVELAIHKENKVKTMLREKRVISHEEIFNLPNGTRFDLSWKYIPVPKLRHSDPNQIIAYAMNVTDAKRAQEKISYLAFYDSLTGLPNRALFLDHLNQAVLLSKQQGNLVSVVYLDVDGFKYINDTLGHANGDMLLKSIGIRIKEHLRETDTLARLGGDEFVILFTGFKNAEQIGNKVREILENLKRPFYIEDKELFITSSMGISVFPNENDTPNDLMKNADMAMYLAKESGKNTFRFYHSELNHRAERRLQIENDLRKALINKEFMVYFQPQFDCSKKELIGAEALIRWKHPIRGMISPGDFIPVAEDSGLIDQLGSWVLEESCRLNKLWQTKGYNPITVSVNVSGKQLANAHLVELILDILNKTKLQPNWLNIELTESSVMENAETSIEIFKQLKSRGIKISIDDFGTGYSSLNYLKKLDADHLKIDKSFVDELVLNADDRAISTAIINLAHTLEMEVVAEGVETKEQLHILTEMGCDIIQGYFYGRPVESNEFEVNFLKQ